MNSTLEAKGRFLIFLVIDPECQIILNVNSEYLGGLAWIFWNKGEMTEVLWCNCQI